MIWCGDLYEQLREDGWPTAELERTINRSNKIPTNIIGAETDLVKLRIFNVYLRGESFTHTCCVDIKNALLVELRDESAHNHEILLKCLLSYNEYDQNGIDEIAFRVSKSLNADKFWKLISALSKNLFKSGAHIKETAIKMALGLD